MLSSIIMAKSVISCYTWAVLLLSMFPSRALGGGRHLPAGPPASFTQVHVNIGRLGSLALNRVPDGTQFQDSRSPTSVASSSSSSHRKILVEGSPFTEFESVKLHPKKAAAAAADSIYGRDRLLVGSSPPTCQGKCGSCSPCNPIHVSIGSPHGALTQQEYYPEVWRCKCGNRLFMP